MSSNSTASPGADAPCCKAKTLLAAAATSFLCCFLLVVVFLFLRFLLLRRRWRHSARLLQEQQQQHRPKLGLDAASIALIPSFPYRRAGPDAECSSSAWAECVVCLSVLDDGQVVRQLPGCKHVFHQECIDVWLASRASCPVCRGKAEPVRAEERAVASASASASARVVAIEMFDDEVLASSSRPGETDETAPWMPPEAGSGLA